MKTTQPEQSTNLDLMDKETPIETDQPSSTQVTTQQSSSKAPEVNQTDSIVTTSAEETMQSKGLREREIKTQLPMVESTDTQISDGTQVLHSINNSSLLHSILPSQQPSLEMDHSKTESTSPISTNDQSKGTIHEPSFNISPHGSFFFGIIKSIIPKSPHCRTDREWYAYRK